MLTTAQRRLGKAQLRAPSPGSDAATVTSASALAPSHEGEWATNGGRAADGDDDRSSSEHTRGWARGHLECATENGGHSAGPPGETNHINGGADIRGLSAGTSSKGLSQRSLEGQQGRGATGGAAGGDAMGSRELLLMALLALQTGAQPLLIRRCVSNDIIITTQVMACEAIKVSMAAMMATLDGSILMLLRSVRLWESLAVAAVPAAIYSLQNTLIQMAHRHVDGVTFNLLNQTKLVSTALFNFIILGKRQSRQQVAALGLMLLAAVLVTTGSSPRTSDPSMAPSWASTDSFTLGILPLLAASMTSGLGSTYCQWILQVRGRNPNLLTMEMCFLSLLMLLLSCATSRDGARMKEQGLFHAWTLLAAIPPLTNAIGGILVGLVTKYAGGVQKGFSVIFGLIIAAILQFFVDGVPLSSQVYFALPLVIWSTYLHARYPHRAKEHTS